MKVFLASKWEKKEEYFAKASLEKDDAGKESEEVNNWCFYFLWNEFNFGLKILILISTSTAILKSAESCLYLESDVNRKNRHVTYGINVTLWDGLHRACLNYEGTWTRHWMLKCFTCTSVLEEVSTLPQRFTSYTPHWCTADYELVKGVEPHWRWRSSVAFQKLTLKALFKKERFYCSTAVSNCSDGIGQETTAVKCPGHRECSPVTHAPVSGESNGWSWQR